MSVDCWHTNGVCFYEGSSLVEGKKAMKKARGKGLISLRMYVEYENGKRLYYFFDKNGKLKSESNNLDN